MLKLILNGMLFSFIGTILTVGSVLLCGFLLGMLIVMLAVAATIGIVYFGFMEIYGLLQSSPENIPVPHYMSRAAMKQESHVHPSKSQTDASQEQHNDHHDD
jgi:NhaP-type Na+/H+ or K+/H+ antiporter